MRWGRRHEIRLFDRPREARPRPEYASFYPALKAGRWMPVRRLLKRIGGDTDSAWREILQTHFEFQGGMAPRNPAWPFLRQRKDDVPPVIPGAGERLARLRQPYAQLYHGIGSEHWLPARELRDRVVHLRELEDQDGPIRRPKNRPSGRILPDEHFEFCLGMSDPGLLRLRTRQEDAALQRPSGARNA